MLTPETRAYLEKLKNENVPLRDIKGVAEQGEAAKWLEEHLSEIFKGLEPTDNISKAEIYLRLAIGFRETGACEKAMHYVEEAEKNLSPEEQHDHFMLARIYFGKAVNLREAKKTGESIAVFEAAIKECDLYDSQRGVDSRSKEIRFHNLKNLGITYLVLKQFEKAFTCFTQAHRLVNMEKEFQHLRPAVENYSGCALIQLAAEPAQLGPPSKAAAVQKAALTQFARTSVLYKQAFREAKEGSYDYISHLLHRGNALRNAKQLQEAIPLLLKAYDIRANHLTGSDAGRTAEAAIGVAQAYFDMGDSNSAKKYYETAIGIYENLKQLNLPNVTADAEIKISEIKEKVQQIEAKYGSAASAGTLVVSGGSFAAAAAAPADTDQRTAPASTM